MRYEIESTVHVDGIGNVKHIHTQEFADESNVFGMVLEYRKYMYKTFPNCEFIPIKATKI